MFRRFATGAVLAVLLAACTTPLALQVTSLAPADGAVDVPVDTVITATFNVAIDPATVTGAFTLSSTGGDVVGVVAYDAASRTATFTPAADLAFATEYTATVAGTVATAGGVTLAGDASWTFTTVAEAESIGGIDVTPVDPDVVVGDDLQLTATPTGVVGSPDLSVTWSSDDETVATVDANGLVTAVAAGTANVTATSVFDPTVSGSTEVTVVAWSIAAIDVTPASDTLAVAGTTQLTATPTGVVGSPDLGVTWSSDDETVATVDADGLVTAVAPGTANIIATSDFDATVSGSAAITVAAPMVGTLENYVATLDAGTPLTPIAPTFTGGAAPFSYALLPNDPLGTPPINGLAPGLALDPDTGVLSGTPTLANFWRAAILVTDAVGQTLELWAEIDVNLVLAYDQTTYTYDPASTGEVVPAGDATVVGAAGPLIFSMVLDDSGPTPGAEGDWSIDPATGAISRVTASTPTTTTWTYTVTVIDDGGSKSATFTVTFEEAL